MHAPGGESFKSLVSKEIFNILMTFRFIYSPLSLL